MHLVITKGNRKGLVFPLEGRPVSIGRDPGATITLDENRASRNHAVIEPADGGGWLIRDLGSTNRTFLNGKPIASAVLKEGDQIRIAGTEMRFQETIDDASPGEISLSMDPQSIQMALRNVLDLEAITTDGSRVANLLGTTSRGGGGGRGRAVRVPPTTEADTTSGIIEVYRGGVRTLISY